MLTRSLHLIASLPTCPGLCRLLSNPEQAMMHKTVCLEMFVACTKLRTLFMARLMLGQNWRLCLLDSLKLRETFDTQMHPWRQRGRETTKEVLRSIA